MTLASLNNIYRYRESDFEVSDGVELVGVNTVIDKSFAKTKKDLTNKLITFWESAKIKYWTKSNIFYRRLNHIQFRYELRIRNPGKVTRKVMLRIWLGLLSDEKDMKLSLVEVFKIFTIICISAPSSLTQWLRWTSLSTHYPGTRNRWLPGNLHKALQLWRNRILCWRGDKNTFLLLTQSKLQPQLQLYFFLTFYTIIALHTT